MFRCILCRSTETDEAIYGEALNDEIQVHTFCLYLTPGLCQAGDEGEGLLGFLIDDIKKETRRIAKLHCCYCSKSYANIGCCNVKCRRTFHFHCGVKHGAENQFVNTYNSYCDQHVRNRLSSRATPKRGEKCYICYENLRDAGQRFSNVNMLQAPCCKNGWFHKLCLQQFAKSSGYFFKCPLCNDKKVFCEKLPYKGIFLYNRDASWELEPNAFAEQLERPSSCVADNCKCLAGREKTTSKNPMLICMACGSVAMHKNCLPSLLNGNNFYCNDCICIGQQGSDVDVRLMPSNESDADDDESEIDVCNDSDENESLAESKGEIINTSLRRIHRIYDEDEDDDDGDDDDDGGSSKKEEEEEFAHCLPKQWVLRRKIGTNKVLDEETDTEHDSNQEYQVIKAEVNSGFCISRVPNNSNSDDDDDDEVQSSCNVKSADDKEGRNCEATVKVQINKCHEIPSQANEANKNDMEEREYEEKDEETINTQTSIADDDDDFEQIPKSSTLWRRRKKFDETSCSSDDSSCSTNNQLNVNRQNSTAGTVESDIEIQENSPKQDSAISSFSNETQCNGIQPKITFNHTTNDSRESSPIESEEEVNSIDRVVERNKLETPFYPCQSSNDSSEGYETNGTSLSTDQPETIEEEHSENDKQNDGNTSSNSSESKFESFSSANSAKSSTSSTTTKSSYKSTDGLKSDVANAKSLNNNARVTRNAYKVMMKRVHNLAADEDETPRKFTRSISLDSENYTKPKTKRFPNENRVQRNFRIENAKNPIGNRHSSIIPYLTTSFKRADGRLKRNRPNVFEYD